MKHLALLVLLALLSCKAPNEIVNNDTDAGKAADRIFKIGARNILAREISDRTRAHAHHLNRAYSTANKSGGKLNPLYVEKLLTDYANALGAIATEIGKERGQLLKNYVQMKGYRNNVTEYLLSRPGLRHQDLAAANDFMEGKVNATEEK